MSSDDEHGVEAHLHYSGQDRTDYVLWVGRTVNMRQQDIEPSLTDAGLCMFIK